MPGFDNRRVTDRTDIEVKATAQVMLLSNQPRVIGTIFGTHCSEPHLVPIPVLRARQSESELAEAPSLTLDSLFVECWVPHSRSQKFKDRITETTTQAGPSGSSCNTTNNDHEERTLPEPFTVFFTDQDEWKSQKRNESVTRMMCLEQEVERGRRSRDQPWYGPILVIKQSKGTEEPLDIVTDDLPVVWDILKQAMKRYHFQRIHTGNPSLNEQQWG